MSNPVSQLVLDQVLERIGAEEDGFNSVFNSLRVGYGLTEDIAIEFNPTEGVSKNFMLADIMPTDWLQTGNPVPPFVTLFAKRSVNKNLQKFHQFSGEVEIGLNVFLSWSSPRLDIRKFQPLANCAEETVYTVFNRCRVGEADQYWSEQVTYNGDVEVLFGPTDRGAAMWVQVLTCKATFEVDQKG